MSRLSCKCGCTLGTSASPSPYSLYIYYEDEVKTALSSNPNITLRDFLMDWDEITSSEKIYMDRAEPVEYWKCLECGRFYEVQAIAEGKKLRAYIPSKTPDFIPDYSEWKRIIVISDIIADEATEKDIHCLLSEFLASGKSIRGWISDDEKEVFLIEDSHLQFYCQE